MTGKLLVDDAGQLFEQGVDGQLIYKGQAEKPPEAPTLVQDMGKGAVRGAVRGAMMPADVSTLAVDHGVYPGVSPPIKALIDAVLMRAGKTSSNRPPSETVLEATGAEKPQTSAGKYTEEGVSGAVSGLMFPGSKVVNAVTGASGGLGGEAAAQVAGDSPVSRVAGALAGTAGGYGALAGGKWLASLMGGPSMHTPKLIHELTRELKPDDWTKAEQVLRDGKTAGVNLTPAQAFERSPELNMLQQRVTQSSAGQGVTTKLQQQNAQAATAAERGLVPGAAAKEPIRLAKEGEEAATEALKTAKKMRGGATAEDYATAFDPTKGTVADVRSALEAQISRIGHTTDAGRWLKQNVLDRLDPKWSTVADGDKVKTVLTEAREKLKDYVAPLEGGVLRASKRDITDGMAPLERWMDAQSVARQQGHKRFAEISKNFVNPLEEGPLGVMAGAKGAVEGKPPAVTRVLGALNSDKIRAQTIEETQRWLHHQQPGLFADIAKNHVAAKIEAAFKVGPEAGVSQADAPAKLAASLWGTAEQPAMRENFRAMIAAAARDLGQSEAQAVLGAEKLMKVLEAAGRGKGGTMLTDVPRGGVADALIARVGPGSSNSMQVRYLANLDELLHGKAYKEIADMLVSPEGMKQLRKWAAFDISKIRWGAAASGAAATGQQAIQAPKED